MDPKRTLHVGEHICYKWNDASSALTTPTNTKVNVLIAWYTSTSMLQLSYIKKTTPNYIHSYIQNFLFMNFY